MALPETVPFFLLHVVVKHRDNSTTFNSKSKVLIKMLLIACHRLIMTDVLQILHESVTQLFGEMVR